MKTLVTRTRRFTPAALIAAAAILPGCANPLFPDNRDLGDRVPVERLRQVDSMRMERYAKPAPPPPKPGESAPAAPDPGAEARRRFEAMEKVDLSLEDCRASALTNNLDLKVSLVSPTIAAERITEEEAAFEAAFTTRALWSETDSPTASDLESAKSEFARLEPGVRIPLRTGGTATVSLPITRNKTSNQFATLNPAYTSDLEFSLSHPLLRDAGRRVNATGIRIASYNRQISESQTKGEVIRQLTLVDRAYWQLYRARRDLDVRQQQYELAQVQLERAERQVRAGRTAEIEVVRAQAGVADRLEAIIVAQNTVLSRQRELKRVVNLPGLDVGTRSAVIPATEPDPVEYLFDAEEIVNTAIAGRMELLEIELRLLADAANIDRSRNQTLPSLSLDATYRINGLGGTANDSFDSLRDNRFEDWSIGANLEIPLGNEGPESRLRQAILTRLQRIGTLDARRQTIRQEVLDAADRIESGWQRILASRQSAVLSARSLAAEQRQFDVGSSTSTDVLDAATRLAEAQLAEIQAVVDYQIAQVDLAAATGTLLGAAKVTWEPSRPVEQPAPVDTEAVGGGFEPPVP